MFGGGEGLHGDDVRRAKAGFPNPCGGIERGLMNLCPSNIPFRTGQYMRVQRGARRRYDVPLEVLRDAGEAV